MRPLAGTKKAFRPLDNSISPAAGVRTLAIRPVTACSRLGLDQNAKLGSHSPKALSCTRALHPGASPEPLKGPRSMREESGHLGTTIDVLLRLVGSPAYAGIRLKILKNV